MLPCEKRNELESEGALGRRRVAQTKICMETVEKNGEKKSLEILLGQSFGQKRLRAEGLNVASPSFSAPE